MIRAVICPLFLLMACEAGEFDGYLAFGSQEDLVNVRVGIADVLEDVSTELWSNTKSTVVGDAVVSPGGGPGGTEHRVSVVLTDEASYIVDRVSVELYSPGRPERELELERDQVDRKVFLLDLVSVAEEGGQSRTDVFTFKLWDLEDDEDPTLTPDTATGD